MARTAPQTMSADRKHLLLLKGAHDAKVERLDNANSKLAELSGRLRSLRQRISEETALLGSRDDAAGTALAEALANDPSASLDASQIDALIEIQAKGDRADAASQAKVRLLEDAARKLDAPIAANERQIEQLSRERDDAWELFLRRAVEVLAGEFRTRFLALRDEVLEPLLALRLHVRNSGTLAYVDCDGPLTLHTYHRDGPDGSLTRHTEYLLRMDAHGRSQELQFIDDRLDAFVRELR